MGSGQPASFGHYDPRSTQPDTANAQQMPTASPAFDPGFMSNPNINAQCYQHVQLPSQSRLFNTGMQMQTPQLTQPFPTTGFNNSNFQLQVDPGFQSLNHWNMANQGYNVGHAPDMHYPEQQQTSAQPDTYIKHDSQMMAAYGGESADSDWEDDPSVQLMAELTHTARSPTPQVHQLPEAFDSKHQEATEGWDQPSVMALDFDQSSISAPDNFQSFENENTAIEAEKPQKMLLDEQVDQAIMDLDDENMQDSVFEEQAVFSRTSEYPDMISHFEQGDAHAYVEAHEDTHALEEADADEDVDVYDDDDTHGDVEGSASEREPSTDLNTTEQPNDVLVRSAVVSEKDFSDAGSNANEEAHDSAVESSTQVEFEGYRVETSPFKTIRKKATTKEDKHLHKKATKLIPHHLPETRYWAAVLVHTIQPHKAKIEKDFIWMKGSRINTVETIWNKYREVTTEEQHRIFFCDDALGFGNTLEELDIFDDRIVVFRAFVKPREVIEID